MRRSFSSRPSRRSSTALAKPAIWAVASVPERRPPSCPPPASSGLGISDPGTDIQRADALGPADLVGGDGEEVRSQRFGGAGDLQKALDRVGVQQGLGVLRRQAPGDLSDGIDVSQLVVHQHAGHQRRVLPDGGEDLLRREGAVLSRDKIRHLVSLPLHPAAGFQHGAVLHCGGNDVAAQVAVLPAGGGDSPVVRLRAAGGEEQLLGPTAQCVRHGLPPDFHPALSSPAPWGTGSWGCRTAR